MVAHYFQRAFLRSIAGWALLLFFLGPSSLMCDEPAFLRRLNQLTICRVLDSEVPDLKIASMRLIFSGYEHVVVDVNDEWIFRFPRFASLIATYGREHWLLTYLKDHVTMPIPYYRYIGVHTGFVGYRKLLGGSLTSAKYLALSDQERERVAEALALFLSQMHEAVDIEEAHTRGFSEQSFSMDGIQAFLDNTQSQEMREMVIEANAYIIEHLRFTENKVLLHADLNGYNLAFDLRTKQINGVFDFSRASIGDYALDFKELISIDTDLARRTADAYALLRNVKNPLMAAFAYFIIHRARHSVYIRKQGYTVEATKYMQILETCIPSWNSFKSKY